MRFGRARPGSLPRSSKRTGSLRRRMRSASKRKKTALPKARWRARRPRGVMNLLCGSAQFPDEQPWSPSPASGCPSAWTTWSISAAANSGASAFRRRAMFSARTRYARSYVRY